MTSKYCLLAIPLSEFELVISQYVDREYTFNYLICENL